MSPPFRLRPAAETDRAFFHGVRREAFQALLERRSSWDEHEELRKGDETFDRGTVQIVEADGTAVGYLCVRHERDHDFVSEIALRPSAQGRGIGSAVLRDTMEDARRRGVPLGLSVYLDNPARHLYARLGFRVLSIEPPRVFMEWQAEPPRSG